LSYVNANSIGNVLGTITYIVDDDNLYLQETIENYLKYILKNNKRAYVVSAFNILIDKNNIFDEIKNVRSVSLNDLEENPFLYIPDCKNYIPINRTPPEHDLGELVEV
jgi:hypothetical protein